MLPYVVKWVLVVQSLSHVQLLWPQGLQHTRSPCPLPSLGVFPSSCLLNQWWHPTNSSSVALFSCFQSFPALRSFPMSWFSASGGQSIWGSASASVLPESIHGWFPGLTGLITLLSKSIWRVFSWATIRKHQFFSAQPYLWYNPHFHTRLLERP